MNANTPIAIKLIMTVAIILSTFETPACDSINLIMNIDKPINAAGATTTNKKTFIAVPEDPVAVPSSSSCCFEIMSLITERRIMTPKIIMKVF